MRKITNIILGWWFWITNRNNEMARARLSVCAKCNDRVWTVCSICGCVLQAKARMPEEECPQKYWIGFKEEIHS